MSDITPQAIAKAITDARTLRGLSPSDLARELGLSPQAVFNWEGAKNLPAAKNMAAIANLLRIDGGKFFIGEVVPLDEAQAKTPPATVAEAQDFEADPSAPALIGSGGPRNVPEVGIAVGGEDGDFEMNGEVIDYVPRPAALARRDVMAIRVKNDSMEPRFREGHLLYVDRKRQPAPGDDAVIELFPAEPDGAGRGFIKEFVSRNMATVVVRQFNPPKEITFQRDRVKAIYRVVPNNELFGV